MFFICLLYFNILFSRFTEMFLLVWRLKISFSDVTWWLLHWMMGNVCIVQKKGPSITVTLISFYFYFSLQFVCPQVNNVQCCITTEFCSCGRDSSLIGSFTLRWNSCWISWTKTESCSFLLLWNWGVNIMLHRKTMNPLCFVFAWFLWRPPLLFLND